jgi:hypothetical protein
MSQQQQSTNPCYCLAIGLYCRMMQIWGVLTWRGERESRTRQINGRAKRVWRWMPTEQEAAQLRPLVQELRQLKRWQRQAAEQQQAAGSSEAAAS